MCKGRITLLAHCSNRIITVLPDVPEQRAVSSPPTGFKTKKVVVMNNARNRNDPFYSAKLRIARANEHLEELTVSINDFFSDAKAPGRYVRQLDPDGLYETYKIEFTKRFPDSWRILATEIIEHLRSALDQATFATAVNPNSNFVSFPFGKTALDLDNQIKGRSKDLKPEIQAFLRTLNAYSGGNDLLYTLNNLANRCKHGLVALVAGVAHNVEIKGTGWNSPVQFLEPAIWDSEKNEIPYARVPLGSDFDHDGKITVYVTIPDAGIERNATLILDRMGHLVSSVVAAIEAESYRIGLFK